MASSQSLVEDLMERLKNCQDIIDSIPEDPRSRVRTPPLLKRNMPDSDDDERETKRSRIKTEHIKNEPGTEARVDQRLPAPSSSEKVKKEESDNPRNLHGWREVKREGDKEDIAHLKEQLREARQALEEVDFLPARAQRPLSCPWVGISGNSVALVGFLRHVQGYVELPLYIEDQLNFLAYGTNRSYVLTYIGKNGRCITRMTTNLATEYPFLARQIKQDHHDGLEWASLGLSQHGFLQFKDGTQYLQLPADANRAVRMHNERGIDYVALGMDDAFVVLYGQGTGDSSSVSAANDSSEHSHMSAAEWDLRGRYRGLGKLLGKVQGKIVSVSLDPNNENWILVYKNTCSQFVCTFSTAAKPGLDKNCIFDWADMNGIECEEYSDVETSLP